MMLEVRWVYQDKTNTPHSHDNSAENSSPEKGARKASALSTQRLCSLTELSNLTCHSALVVYSLLLVGRPGSQNGLIPKFSTEL